MPENSQLQRRQVVQRLLGKGLVLRDGDDAFAADLMERLVKLLHEVTTMTALAREVVGSGEQREPLAEIGRS